MTRTALILALGGILAAGCASQNVVERTFYEPNKETLTRREDGYAVGAVKSETIKSGSRDEGDKALAVGLVNTL